MKVICLIENYNDNGKPLDTPKIEVRSVFANGNMAEIEYNGLTLKVSIDELKSALDKCRLNCFGCQETENE